MIVPLVVWRVASEFDPAEVGVTGLVLAVWACLVLHLGVAQSEAFEERVAGPRDVIAAGRARRGRPRRLRCCDQWTLSTDLNPTVYRPARGTPRGWWDPDRPGDWDQAPPGSPLPAPDEETPASELPARAPYERRAAA